MTSDKLLDGVVTDFEVALAGGHGISSRVARIVEVKFDRKIVLPLVDIIRRQVGKFEQSSNGASIDPLPAAHRRVARLDLDDLQTLAGLFQPDFPNSPVIRISLDEVPAILRACTVLRFDLRRGPLMSVSDAVVESGDGLELESMSDEIRPAWMCCLFLATIQEHVLEQFDLPPPQKPPSETPLWRRLLNRFGKPASTSFAAASQPEPPSWQVVVMNDPVNRMNYVSAVFRHVIGLSMNDAIKRMREVHEVKESVVWTGEKEKAEAYVAALQSWHLNAVLRSAADR